MKRLVIIQLGGRAMRNLMGRLNKRGQISCVKTRRLGDQV